MFPTGPPHRPPPSSNRAFGCPLLQSRCVPPPLPTAPLLAPTTTGATARPGPIFNHAAVEARLPNASAPGPYLHSRCHRALTSGPPANHRFPSRRTRPSANYSLPTPSRSSPDQPSPPHPSDLDLQLVVVSTCSWSVLIGIIFSCRDPSTFLADGCPSYENNRPPTASAAHQHAHLQFSTQPPPSGAHHAQVVRRCHLRPFNYAALRRSSPSETATSTKTPPHAQCSVRHNTRSSCKTAANIQRLARPSSIDGLHRPLEPVQVLAVILYLQLRVSNNTANRKGPVKFNLFCFSKFSLLIF
ncbi:uncharacterized protein LOC119354016 [Triticum dicoccoides]|nr:uncharacterized protein LOC119354016 [Triticum dicoccoides]